MRHRSKILNGIRDQIARLKDFGKTFPKRSFAIPSSKVARMGIANVKKVKKS